MPKKITVKAEEVFSPQETVSNLFEKVSEYLESKDWTFHANPYKNLHSFYLRLRNGTARTFVDTAQAEGWSRMLVQVQYPTFVPLTRRREMCEAIARVNFSIGFRNFDMDLLDGEVRVRTWLEAEGCLSEDLIDRAIRRGLDLADQYQAALLAVAFGNAKPEEILELGAVAAGETLQ